MDPDEYAETLTAVNKLSSLMAYEAAVVHWLESYPCMTAAQVRDWLGEHFALDAAERTVRRFVAQLREKYAITRHMNLCASMSLSMKCLWDINCSWISE